MTAINVSCLTKRYSTQNAGRPLTIQEAFLAGFGRGKHAEQIRALTDVSFAVSPGETLGIIGRNGAGKSTLLKLLGRVLEPDHGSIETNGRVSALLDPYGSFHRDLTGRENAFAGAVMCGLSRREARERIDSIVRFAELESFVDLPVRAYSEGMRMRLAIAVAIYSDPQVLLIDELLSSGDLAFHRKCLDCIKQLKSLGTTFVMVSHNLDEMRMYSDKILHLRGGRVAGYGDPDTVCAAYTDETVRA